MKSSVQRKYIRASMLFMAISAIILSVKYRISKHLETPRYGTYSPTSETVSFHDNCAPGMKAFVIYNKNKIEMTSGEINAEYHTFQVPREALNSGRFTVQAEDRDGHKSKKQKLRVLEGIVIED